MLVQDRLGTPPKLTATVAREYVHRAALADVFLTGWEATAKDTFRVTAQWPRSHGFYEWEHGLYDPLLLCETFRQTFPLLNHAEYGVPFGHQLFWHQLQYTLDPREMAITSAPAEIELLITCSDIRLRRGIPTEMSMSVAVLRDGRQVATASTRIGILAPAVYQRLRATRADLQHVFGSAPLPPPPISRRLVGRSRHQDVVLAQTPHAGRWKLRADTSHPVLFDHAVDHAPGMLLLEAVRQAGLAVQPAGQHMMPTSMDVAFVQYVEFDSPCWIEAHPAPGPTDAPQRRVRIEAIQEGRVMLTAAATLTGV
ncbi:ScbA/BarX family gamma-butyrolactone biosynthesis protein [Streptomyces sp. NPDC021093]|uniref:ScbA/BarX family gamma-butyrolactone biosynthesis protein n=1 Tax=Streptomyces sp. NPDC021093 TaxID=3365112 RepID=UPI0037AA0660